MRNPLCCLRRYSVSSELQRSGERVRESVVRGGQWPISADNADDELADDEHEERQSGGK